MHLEKTISAFIGFMKGVTASPRACDLSLKGSRSSIFATVDGIVLFNIEQP